MSEPAVASPQGAPDSADGCESPLGARFEALSWVFMRASGLLLIFLALYHLTWWNLVIGVEHLDSQIVAERWGNPLWRLFNVLLVSFALLHGLNGARYSIEDYLRPGGAQLAVKIVVYGVVLATLAIGVFALLAFDPAAFFADS